MRKKIWNPAKWDGSGKRHEDVHGWNTEKMWIPQVSWIQPGFQEGLIVELAVGKAHLQSAMWTGEQWPTNLLVDLDYAVWVINCPVLGSTVYIYIFIIILSWMRMISGRTLIPLRMVCTHHFWKALEAIAIAGAAWIGRDGCQQLWSWSVVV